MNKKITKITSTVLSVLAMLALCLPQYSAVIGEGETWYATLRGFNLAQFSPWGAVALLIPPILMAVMYSTLESRTKTVLNVCACLTGAVSLYFANTSMREWICTEASGYVQPYGGVLVFTVLMMASAVLCHISINAPPSHTRSVSVTFPDILNEEFLLFDRPIKFSKFQRGSDITEFDGCISLVTDSGYFAALGHGEDMGYINNGCIEVYDGEDNIGYTMRITRLGIYGTFSEKYEKLGKERVRIKPFGELCDGKGELWLYGERKKVSLEVKGIYAIECTPDESIADAEGKVGAPVIADGKVAAIVSGYDSGRGVFTCISAEAVAADLARMVFEQQVYEELQQFCDD